MDPISIQSVACVGAGTIGSSWAVLFALKGYNVRLCDISTEALTDGLSAIKASLDTLVQGGRVRPEDVPSVLRRIATTRELAEALEGADYVQESGPERYQIKTKLFAEMDSLVPLRTIIASSSSGLLMTRIQKATRYPGRCIVAHPFNPPHIVPLVEIVPGQQTSAETVQRTREFMVSLGKIPVVLKKEVRKYIVNRLAEALASEAAWLVGQGVATAAEIDLAVRTGPGLRWALMGPFMISNLSTPGGFEEAMLGKFEEPAADGPSQVTALSGVPSDELGRWANQCVADMKEELVGKDVEAIKRWRDAKILEILDLLGPLGSRGEN